MGVASLVLGIISLVCALLIPAGYFVGAIVGLIGVVLGAMGRKNPEKKGIATAGLVCSIIGLIFSVLFFVICGGCAACSICASAASAA